MLRKRTVVRACARLVRALQLDKIARLKVFPVALSAPWLVAPAMLPEVPLPRSGRRSSRRSSSTPIPGASTTTFTSAKYTEVRESIQKGIDALARRRTFPIFG